MHDYEEPDDLEPGEEIVTDKEINSLIDDELSLARPDRYDSGDMSWMDPVIAKAHKAILRKTHAEIAADAARRRVMNREGQASARTTKVLLNIADSGQLPIGWGDGPEWRDFLRPMLRLPLKIDRQRRVAFGASTANDIEEWELQYRRGMDMAQDAGNRACKGAALLVDWLRGQGVRSVEDLRA